MFTPILAIQVNQVVNTDLRGTTCSADNIGRGQLPQRLLLLVSSHMGNRTKAIENQQKLPKIAKTHNLNPQPNHQEPPTPSKNI